MREVTAPVLSPPQLLTLAAHHPLTQPPCLTEHRLGSVDSAIPENVRAQTCVRLPSMSMGSVCVSRCWWEHRTQGVFLSAALDCFRLLPNQELCY